MLLWLALQPAGLAYLLEEGLVLPLREILEGQAVEIVPSSVLVKQRLGVLNIPEGAGDLDALYVELAKIVESVCQDLGLPWPAQLDPRPVENLGRLELRALFMAKRKVPTLAVGSSDSDANGGGIASLSAWTFFFDKRVLGLDVQCDPVVPR